MNRDTLKTALGVVVALGVLARLLLNHGPITRDDVLLYGAFLLFAGVLIDPADFKSLAFWKKDGAA
jgi:hypothetical protein